VILAAHPVRRDQLADPAAARADPPGRRLGADLTVIAPPSSGTIGEYGLQRLNAIIGAYEAFLDQVRGTDDLSFHLVLDLLAAETHQRADLQAALAQRS
jgi:hypothetical protein